MNYLLDTCVISELIKPKAHPKVLAWIAAMPEERLHLSVLTLGELQKGITKLGSGLRPRKLQQWLDIEVRQRFAGRIFAFDEETLLCWGRIAGEAERRSHPLPVLDSLLAATAMAHHLVLVTRNINDMPRTGVEVFNPWEGD